MNYEKYNVVTGETIKQWLEKPFCYGAEAVSTSCYYPDIDTAAYSSKFPMWMLGGLRATPAYWSEYVGIGGVQHQNTFAIDVPKYNGTRLIGYIEKENADGTLQIELLGDGLLRIDKGYSYRVSYNVCNLGKLTNQGTVINRDYVCELSANINYGGLDCTRGRADAGLNTSPQLNFYDVIVPLEEIFDVDYKKYKATDGGHSCFFANCGYYNNQLIRNNTTFDLSSGKLQLGVVIPNSFKLVCNDETFETDYYKLNGDWYNFLDYLNKILYSLNNYKKEENMPTGYIDIANERTEHIPFGYSTTFYDDVEQAMNWIPFNIPLTKNRQQAVNYINTGDLPSDAFLITYDLDNFGRIDDSIPNEDEGDLPDYGEDGGDDSDIDDTPLVPPRKTAQALTNNNLYWLQSGTAESFINWFWTQLGDITDLDSLLNAIKGLYSDVVQAIISFRFMPININWVGGTSSSDRILLAKIAYSTPCEVINKTVTDVRHIGSITIKEKKSAFTDYSPYSDLHLYLPYYGFIDLDNNLFINKTLTVKASYDIISGTIQYFIFVNNTIVNTVVAKMSVEIPITLQSHFDVQSAITSNLISGGASLIGGVTSVASGNPIGLLMSTQSLTGAQAHSAPLSVKGTVGESGAFYAFNKCVLYRKRPRYNRPKAYASRCGYPYNEGVKIDSLKGYFTVYNPTITFKQSVKPLESEVQEIYELLEKGVIK